MSLWSKQQLMRALSDGIADPLASPDLTTEE